MTFKAIETQEDFDKAVSERINREKDTLNKKYADYDDLKKQVSTLTSENTSLKSTISANKEKYSDYDKNIDDLNSKIKGFETEKLRTKVALDNGLPYDLAERLVGDSEEDLTKDAQRLAGVVKPRDPVPPLKEAEPNKGSDENNAYKNMINNLGIEGE